MLDSTFELQTMAISWLTANTSIELPGWRKAQIRMQRPEQYDTFLVYVRQLFIELSRGEPIGTTKLNGPALKDYFTMLPPISGWRTRARLGGGSKSIRDIPSFTIVVRDNQRLILTEIGSVDIHLYNQRRRLVVGHIWPLPFSEVLEQYISVIDDYVELQDDRSASVF